ncbi:hypothetical protein GTO27_01775 [Candidatus Bathyarchaeota archaeon]|nr:hypothetical protein [Candidatus Bathyarchaeota archaeon]
MKYEATLKKEGKIALPQVVIEKLRVKDGDKVAFIAEEFQKETYFYLTTPESEMAKILKRYEKPTTR